MSAPAPRESPRTPIVLGIIAAVLLVAVIVTLAIAFTRGSDAEADPTSPSPTGASATRSATPTPTSDATRTPVSITFAGTGFTLADASGTAVFGYDWRDDAKAAVTALTSAFGTTPTQRIEPGDGNQYPDYTVYQWDGFMLFDMVVSPGGTPRAEYAQPSYALFSRNEVGGIRMVAERGLTVGMSIADVRALAPDQEIPRGNVGATRFVFEQARSSAAAPLQYSLFADTDGTVVTAILYFRYAGR